VNPTLPDIRIRVEEALALVAIDLAKDDLERATQWAALALSANDDGHRDD
jgi:hypothetical protein